MVKFKHTCPFNHNNSIYTIHLAHRMLASVNFNGQFNWKSAQMRDEDEDGANWIGRSCLQESRSRIQLD